jgi:hypothetical protein
MTANSGEALKQARFSGSAMRRREAWPEFCLGFAVTSRSGLPKSLKLPKFRSAIFPQPRAAALQPTLLHEPARCADSKPAVRMRTSTRLVRLPAESKSSCDKYLQFYKVGMIVA